MNLLTLFLRTSRRRLGIAIVAALSSGFSTTVLIIIVNQMIRLHGHIPRTFVFTFAALCCVRLVCGIGSHALLVTLSQKALHDLRIELCQQIAAAPLTELEQIGSTPLPPPSATISI